MAPPLTFRDAEEGIKQDIQIAVACDHTFEDEPKDRLPTGSRSRLPLFPLLAEFGKTRVIKSLSAGDKDRMD